jgi:hypothetical protein
MDIFLETLLGSRKIKLKISKNSKSVQLENHTDSSILEVLVAFKIWLKDVLPKKLALGDKDLYNIIDEIVADVNKTLYLFTLT